MIPGHYTRIEPRIVMSRNEVLGFPFRGSSDTDLVGIRSKGQRAKREVIWKEKRMEGNDSCEERSGNVSLST